MSTNPLYSKHRNTYCIYRGNESTCMKYYTNIDGCYSGCDISRSSFQDTDLSLLDMIFSLGIVMHLVTATKRTMLF